MNSNAPNAPPDKKPGSSLRSRWLNHRRKRFWLIVVVLLYTLVGFFLAPVLVSHYGLKAIEEATGRDAMISEVRVNPYVLSLEVSGFSLNDTDGERLLSFDRLFVNFQASSLFRWAWTFREISLESPYLFDERGSDGDTRLARLQADMASRSTDDTADEDEGGLPRLLIDTLAISAGGARWLDHFPADTVDIAAGPVNVTVHDLNTLPDRDGRQHVSVSLPNGARLEWEGTLVLQPLNSTGSLSLTGARLDITRAYMEAMLPISQVQGVIEFNTDYQLSLDDGGQLAAQLENMHGKLSGLELIGLEPETGFLSIERIELEDGSLTYPDNRLEIGSIEVVQPALEAWLDENGQLSLDQLLATETGTEAAEERAQEEGEPWQIRIGSFALTDGAVALEDRSIEPIAALRLQSLEVTLDGVGNQDNERIPVRSSLAFDGGGSARFEGVVVALPEIELEGRLALTDLPLALGQPYVQQQLAVAIEGGALATELDLALQPDGAVTATGELRINGLELRNTREDESLLAWQQMSIDRYEVDSKAGSVRLSAVRFDRPYGRIRINEDLSTNLDGLFVENPETTEAGSESDEPEASDEAAVALLVGGITVADGAMDFSDLSLPLPFGTQVSSMDGTVSTIDNQSAEPANIRLEGQVDEFGLARIEGSMNLLDPVRHTDVSVEFRNLLMSNLSPYSVAFAGREIDEGKLDLDLLYKIDQGQLAGENDIVLSDLVLGGEVESPDAVSLPLDLAVALLKNSEGVIDVSLPVAGDINDPEFRIGGVVWQAFKTLITKIVSAPFKLLGNLIGVDSEDFGQFEFLAGRYDLTPPELEKVGQIREALSQRPELAVEIGGVYDPAIDTPVLQYQQLRTAVFERMGRDPTVEAERGELLSDEIRGVLESLFTETFPQTPLEEVKAAHSAPPADDPEGKPVVDELAYAGDLRDRLLAAQAVGEADLIELARFRAQAVNDAFLASGLETNRVRLSEPSVAESEDGEWVVMELGVADAP